MRRKKVLEIANELMEAQTQKRDQEPDTIQPAGKQRRSFVSFTREDYTPAILRVDRIEDVKGAEEKRTISRIQRRQQKAGRTKIRYNGKDIVVQESYSEVLEKIATARIKSEEDGIG